MSCCSIDTLAQGSVGFGAFGSGGLPGYSAEMIGFLLSLQVLGVSVEAGYDPLLALPADSSEGVRTEVALVVRDLRRLQAWSQKRRDLLAQIRSVLDRHPGEAGILYCIRRADVDSLCAALVKLGYRALPYHAGLGADERRTNQAAFSREETDLIVATVAFGMGIDRSDVRAVIHLAPP